MLGIRKNFWKLDRANISQILAVKPNSRNEQDNTSGCSLVETNELRQEQDLKRLKQVFKNYVSRSEKCPLDSESVMDTSNFPPRSESLQRSECELRQPISSGDSNRSFRLRLRIEAGHGVVLASEKILCLKRPQEKDV